MTMFEEEETHHHETVLCKNCSKALTWSEVVNSSLKKWPEKFCTNQCFDKYYKEK